MLAALATLFLATGGVPQGAAEEQERLVGRATALWCDERDYDGALRAFDDAVALDPEHVETRMGRANYLYWLAGAATGDPTRFRDRAIDDYQFVSRQEPDSRVAGVARDAIRSLLGTRLFPSASVLCSEEADAAAESASALWGAERFGEALDAYTRASELCPESARLRVYRADTLYALGRYEEAARGFRSAFEVDPWNREGHRFLADAEWRLAHREAALREVALAIVSDPTYEAAWASLRNLAEASGRDYLRLYREKATVAVFPEEDRTELTIPPGVDDASEMAWIAYLTVRAAAIDERGLDVPDPDRLASERHAVEETLKILEEVSASDPEAEQDPFWVQIARARDAGFLDEAIFLHLLEADLVPAYLDARAEGADRLVTYVLEHLVPVR